MTCNQPVLTPEVVNYVQARDQATDNVRGNVLTLWETNEVFREQYRDAAKLERDASKKRMNMKKEVDALKREWKEKTSGYQTVLKNMRETYIRRFREIKGKREAAIATNKAQRAKRILRDTYDLGYYELEELSGIRGAPKIGGVTRRWKRWYMNPQYAFRFWLR